MITGRATMITGRAAFNTVRVSQLTAVAGLKEIKTRHCREFSFSLAFPSPRTVIMRLPDSRASGPRIGNFFAHDYSSWTWKSEKER
jgi:hypothetical protein